MAVRGCLVGDLDIVVRDCGSPRATVEGGLRHTVTLRALQHFLTMMSARAGAAVKAEVRVKRD